MDRRATPLLPGSGGPFSTASEVPALAQVRIQLASAEGDKRRQAAVQASLGRVNESDHDLPVTFQ